MKKSLLILTIAVLAGAAVYGFSLFQGKEKEKTVNNFKECVDARYQILETYPRQCKTPSGKTFTEDIGNELEKRDLIRITSPRPNQLVFSPLEVTGEARGIWFFEASFPVKLYDANGKLLATAVAQAQGEWMTENFVPFKAEVVFSKPSTDTGLLVLEKDNPSGLPENADELRVPVKFGSSETSLMVKAYFGRKANETSLPYFNNSEMDPEFSCNKVFSVERQIAKTQAVGRASLEQLFAGPSSEEKEDGFFTSINEGVEIQSLTIESGSAKADFNSQLEFQVGGSCKVAAIRAQITETLKQFSSVTEVIISIDGRTEDILQP